MQATISITRAEHKAGGCRLTKPTMPRLSQRTCDLLPLGALVRLALRDAGPGRRESLEAISDVIRNQLLPSTVKACRHSEIPLAGDGYVVPGHRHHSES